MFPSKCTTINSILILISLLHTCIPLNELELPDYDYTILRAMKKDIRERFLEKRIRNREKNKKLELLNRTSRSDFVYLDDVAHFDVKLHKEQKRRVQKMERNFRNMLAMRDVTYVFKRDTFWRTWRDVEYPEGRRKVWYRCSNVLNETCKSCMGGGYWVSIF